MIPTCKCGSNKIFFGVPYSDRPNTIGIYCDSCGRWLKWANKNEKNFLLKEKNNEK